MRSIPFFAPVFAFSVAFMAYGCTLDVSGADPATSSAGGAGPGSSTVTGPGSTVTSAGTSAGGGGSSVTTTVAASSSTGCASDVEVCDDGKDNNCDGLIDCADPQCSGPTDGRACVAPAPAGWTLVAFAPGAAATCPKGYGGLTPVEEAPTSSDPTCNCMCDCPGIANNPCVHGQLNPNIGNSCTAVALTLAVTGGCDALPSKFPNIAYQSIKATPLPVTPIDLAGKPMLPGTQPGGSGATCAPDASTAGGCTGNEMCLPKTPSGSLCVQKDGDVDCPGGAFTKKALVGAPGAVDDQRSCNACTCTSSAASCANPTFSGYSNGQCNSAAVPAAVVANTCSFTSNGDWANDDHYIYSATPTNPTCSLKGAAPDVIGEVKPKNPTTICCAP